MEPDGEMVTILQGPECAPVVETMRLPDASRPMGFRSTPPILTTQRDARVTTSRASTHVLEPK